MYRKIDPDDWRRIFLVGDLHGCYDQLLDKLEKFAFDTDRDLLISVGDLIDRGKQNLECLGLLGQKWFCAVRGNHEQMAMEAVAGNDYDLWLINGGGWFFRLNDRQQQQAKTLITECALLPLVIDIELGKQHFVVARIIRRITTFLIKRSTPHNWSGAGGGLSAIRKAGALR
jgi:serine/threonine protein phosphatase 1